MPPKSNWWVSFVAEYIYTTFIRPRMEYSNVIFDNCTGYKKQELDIIQNETARIATGAKTYIHWKSTRRRKMPALTKSQKQPQTDPVLWND